MRIRSRSREARQAAARQAAVTKSICWQNVKAGLASETERGSYTLRRHRNSIAGGLLAGKGRYCHPLVVAIDVVPPT